MSKTTKARNGQPKSAKRREELRRTLPKPALGIYALFQRPEMVNLAAIILGFVLVAGVLVIWSREQVKVRDGRIMTDTRLKRLDYQVVDPEATSVREEEARRLSPQIWSLNNKYLDYLASSLNGLPKAVAGKNSVDVISEALRLEYDLTDIALATLQSYYDDGRTTDQWQEWVENLVSVELMRRPLLKSTDYTDHWVQRESDPNLTEMLRNRDKALVALHADPIELNPDTRDELELALTEMAARAGFPDTVVRCVAAKILTDPAETIRFDNEATALAAKRAAATVDPVMITHHRQDPLYKRGDRLSADQYRELLVEAQNFTANGSAAIVWSPRGAVAGLICLLGLFLGTYLALAYPRIVRNSLRVLAISGLMVGMLALSVAVTTQAPNFLIPAAVAPTMFLAVVLLLAYDQRLAVFLSGLQCILVTLALEGSIGMFVLLVVGCVTAISQLREVRNRNSVVRASGLTALALGVGTIALGFLQTPLPEGLVRPALNQILVDATYAVLAAFGVGFLLLGILPSIERLFDITTGMTLAELRDPKQPLLRQLQQRAPGTYNHSLQVATIAEAATDAIGADSLLVYVGALYHDIGKMNKPEYFVENQARGSNKHDKLSPAMSLLVIVGHVKDGIELAREYGLPRSIIHFIESHHGTTLVEYFYHAAKTMAQADDKGSVEEFEFRYPGPKPRTKEAAVLMLSDAVESATRAMSEPNPSRIESLVRELSRKRLLDGQFDQCDLTFRELGLIEEAVISRLCAIHHGRISYPSNKPSEPAAGAEKHPPAHAKPA